MWLNPEQLKGQHPSWVTQEHEHKLRHKDPRPQWQCLTAAHLKPWLVVWNVAYSSFRRESNHRNGQFFWNQLWMFYLCLSFVKIQFPNPSCHPWFLSWWDSFFSGSLPCSLCLSMAKPCDWWGMCLWSGLCIQLIAPFSRHSPLW